MTFGGMIAEVCAPRCRPLSALQARRAPGVATPFGLASKARSTVPTASALQARRAPGVATPFGLASKARSTVATPFGLATCRAVGLAKAEARQRSTVTESDRNRVCLAGVLFPRLDDRYR